MAAEAAKNALDGSVRKGRNLTVRFATLSTAIHVSNLGPLVSNEMLEKAFSAFGDVERAVVVVDDRGRSKGYGRVEYARKGNAINALQKTSEGFFMIGRYVLLRGIPSFPSLPIYVDIPTMMSCGNRVVF